MGKFIAEALQPGTQLQGGKYIIQQVLGQGATGITYVASFMQTLQGTLGSFDQSVSVAVKEFYMKSECQRNQTTSNVVVPNSKSQRQVDQFKKSFIKEAKRISSLSHPNIVHVLDVFDDNGTVYYVMQFITGGSIKEYIDKFGAVPEMYAIKFTRQIASALSYMHNEKHMCHYDIKPGNIMLTGNGMLAPDCNAMLIDFGIAKNYDEQGNETSTTPPGLTKGFAPIEQYSSIADFSPKSDVYSLGATLYTMLTGQTPPEPMYWLSGQPFTPKPENVSDRAWGIVQYAMTLTSHNRPTMMELLGVIDQAPVRVNDKTSYDDGPDGNEVTLTFDQLKNMHDEARKDGEETIFGDENEQNGRQTTPNVQKSPETPTPQPAAPPVRKKKKGGMSSGLIIALCVLIGIVVAGGVTFGVMHMTNKETTEATEEVPDTLTEKPIYSGEGRIIMRYTGDVENGQPVGRGKITYLEDQYRESYEGAFLNGLREDSMAVLTYRNGDIYRGQFIADHFGTGTYFIKESGEYYRGTFKNDQPYNGYWYDKDDNVVSRVENGESR